MATRVLSYRVFYFTLYSLGLRLGEGLALKVGDIDADRLRVQVGDAKGNRDRLVPLPQVTLTVLRRFWQMHRHPELLFPNRHAGLKGAQLATSPLDRGGEQKTLRQVASDCGLKKRSPRTRPAQGLPALAQLRLPAPQPQKPDCLAAHRPQDRTAHAAQRETLTGISLPLLRYTDAGHPAPDSGPWGPATKFGADGGDDRVNHGHGKDDAPTGATAALGLKMPENRVLTAEFAEPARAER